MVHDRYAARRGNLLREWYKRRQEYDGHLYQIRHLQLPRDDCRPRWAIDDQRGKRDGEPPSDQRRRQPDKCDSWIQRHARFFRNWPTINLARPWEEVIGIQLSLWAVASGVGSINKRHGTVCGVVCARFMHRSRRPAARRRSGPATVTVSDAARYGSRRRAAASPSSVTGTTTNLSVLRCGQRRRRGLRT